MSPNNIIAFMRLDDGELFTRNADGTTYSMESQKQEFPAHKAMEWSAATLERTEGFLPIYTRSNLARYAGRKHGPK